MDRPELPPGPYGVVGLGRAGFAAARALAKRVGPGEVRAWDSVSDPTQLGRASQLAELGVQVELGGDGIALLGDARTVVKSPGVPPEIPVIGEARRRGALVVDELEIGWLLAPARTVAVTGTNGKSTVCSLCMEVLGEHGLDPVLAGNTEYGPPLSELSLGSPPRTVVAEVSSYQAESSHALAVDAAIFTNLTRDHLNRHRTMAAYGEAKRRLFVRDDWVVPLAVLNLDDDLGRRIAADVEAGGGRVLGYGCGGDAAYRIAAASWTLQEAELEVEAPDGALSVRSRLPGPHNAANAVAVLALSDGLGLERQPTLAALSSISPLPGRFEVVDAGQPFGVVVDFGFSAASVGSTLGSARELVAPGGRLIAVLGIVGRSGISLGREVGALARGLTDHLVLSGVSYRGEPRLVTLAELAAGARGAPGGNLEIVIDRREAIARALAAAGPGDMVVILGRGPTGWEATDARGGMRPLDDRQVVRELSRDL